MGRYWMTDRQLLCLALVMHWSKEVRTGAMMPWVAPRMGVKPSTVSAVLQQMKRKGLLSVSKHTYLNVVVTQPAEQQVADWVQANGWSAS